MAEFSKEFCDITGHPDPDFDLEPLFSKLYNLETYPCICEGFGFSRIGKDKDGNREVYYRGKWIGWAGFIENFKQQRNG